MVHDRIEKLAVDIREYYGDEELHVLCVLKGSRGSRGAPQSRSRPRIQQGLCLRISGFEEWFSTFHS